MLLFESSRVGWEDSNSNNFKPNCFYLDFCFYTKFWHLFLQNIAILYVIFSSFVSVHIMVYNCASASIFFGVQK